MEFNLENAASSFDITQDPIFPEENWMEEDASRMEVNSQDVTCSNNTEQGSTIQKTTWMFDNIVKNDKNDVGFQEASISVNTEQELEDVDEEEEHFITSPINPAVWLYDNNQQFQWDCYDFSYDDTIENYLHGTEIAEGSLDFEFNLEDEETGASLKSEQSEGFMKPTEVSLLKPDRKIKHQKVSRASQKIKSSDSSSKIPDMNATGRSHPELMDKATKRPRHDTQKHSTKVGATVKRTKATANGVGFQCEVCQMTFRFLCLLKRHMLTHSKDKPYQCSVCPAAFKSSSNLKLHTLNHSDIKPHECNVCSASFLHLCVLKRHMLTHSTDKPYQCSVCPAAFKSSSNLKIHTLSHSDIKPHECDVCSASFRHLYILKRHMVTHQEDKPHQCHVCKATFKRVDILKQHLLIHTNHKPHQCSVCERTYTRLTYLKHHMLTHNNP